MGYNMHLANFVEDFGNKIAIENFSGAPEAKKMLSQITTDNINVPPVKQCAKCVGCKNCKKVHLPDQARQLAQAEIVRQSLSFDNKGCRASYPYNKLLSQLEENKEPCKRNKLNAKKLNSINLYTQK